MKKIQIQGQNGGSTILIGESFKRIESYTRSRRLVVITDPVVHRLYGQQFPTASVVRIGTGEQIKTLDTVRSIYSHLLELKADRSCVIVGIGGGIVCDIAGFVASTFMRGMPFGLVATTLLAQVDASVGGKNGVNLGGFKNMVGVFQQPEFVICDPEVLATLPEKELRCGMAEAIKHGAIYDAAFFDYLEGCHAKALQLDPEVIQHLVYECVRIKAAVVNRDEKEAGERRKLNFGHTLGHALEKRAGLAHGEAVSCGMAAAAWMSEHKGWLPAADARRLEALLQAAGLPVRMPVDPSLLADTLAKDKKREGDRLHFVFLRCLGEAAVEAIGMESLSLLVEAIKPKVRPQAQESI